MRSRIGPILSHPSRREPTRPTLRHMHMDTPAKAALGGGLISTLAIGGMVAAGVLATSRHGRAHRSRGTAGRCDRAGALRRLRLAARLVRRPQPRRGRTVGLGRPHVADDRRGPGRSRVPRQRHARRRRDQRAHRHQHPGGRGRRARRRQDRRADRRTTPGGAPPRGHRRDRRRATRARGLAASRHGVRRRLAPRRRPRAPRLLEPGHGSRGFRASRQRWHRGVRRRPLRPGRPAPRGHPPMVGTAALHAAVRRHGPPGHHARAPLAAVRAARRHAERDRGRAAQPRGRARPPGSRTGRPGSTAARSTTRRSGPVPTPWRSPLPAGVVRRGDQGGGHRRGQRGVLVGRPALRHLLGLEPRARPPRWRPRHHRQVRHHPASPEDPDPHPLLRDLRVGHPLRGLRRRRRDGAEPVVARRARRPPARRRLVALTLRQHARQRGRGHWTRTTAASNRSASWPGSAPTRTSSPCAGSTTSQSW